ncbi:MAG: hypothetical protein K9J37_22535 [Saprospiraceae bacterium]|nr:hypothetical protein [Saprospiraceae bacterium]MCF8252702.1 hypothetical protein [Saprospiraceae bacterium]MCF8282926.1 hypothetical protein [Bacteroidales bacterium]MCF8311650.1 hypothetical protein [Saprospiraceae bacterium]MCF8440991.1 hypothetical protein [Saprospiraceae bacterium]
MNFTKSNIFQQKNRPGGEHFSAWFLLFLAVIIILGACTNSGKRSKDDRQLGRIYDKTLFLSDMDGMLPQGITKEDSTLIINTYVRYWMREMALLREAEQNIPKDLNLEKLVADYRSSLIKNNYGTLVMNRLLDSTVTTVQLQEFYEKNKEQYQLETPILRCRFIKAPRNAPNSDKAQDWWNSNKVEDFAELSRWCSQQATVSYLQDSTWYHVDDIAAFMPQGTLTVDNVENRRDFIQRDDNFVYYFKLLELVRKKEIAPLSYIENQARKVILHKRKTELLEELKDKLYQEAIRKKNLEVYE